jgi:hypothetical protein
MDLTVLLGSLALLVSIVALAASSYLASRQVRIMHHANHLPALLNFCPNFVMSSSMTSTPGSCSSYRTTRRIWASLDFQLTFVQTS